jgi:hypothetical protein
MSRKRRRKGDAVLIEALARGSSVAQACKLVGLSSRTVFRRLLDPSFQEAIRDCRSKMFTDAAGALAATMKRASMTLRRLLVDESPSIRLSSARAILEAGQKLREALDLEERIAAVENQLRGNAP